MNIRVVGGATVDLTSFPPSTTQAFIDFYKLLSSNKIVTLRSLKDKVDMLPDILTETLARRVLIDNCSDVTIKKVKKIDKILTPKELEKLKKYNWPGEFHELIEFVNNAIFSLTF